MSEATLADDQTPTGDREEGGPSPPIDAAALRARLGLKPTSGAAAEPSSESDAPSSYPDPGATPAEGIRAPVDSDATPIPQRLPGSRGPSDETPGGSGRVPVKPVVVAMVVVVLVAGFLGRILGDSLAGREQRQAHGEIAAKKLSYFRDAKTASGASVLEAIATMKVDLRAAVRAIDTVETTGGNPLELEKTFELLLPKLQRYKKESVFIDPERAGDDVIIVYADDVLLQAVRYASRTRHLYDTIVAAIDEASALARMTRPAGAMTQTVMVKRTQREVEGLGKIPAADGLWIQDLGKPDLVQFVEEGRKRKTTDEQWMIMALTVGATEPEQVPTDDVVSLDMRPMYERQAKAVRLHMVDRLAGVVRKASTVAGTVNWKQLEKKLSHWVQ